jgi:predicted small lipoprotein YifL
VHHKSTVFAGIVLGVSLSLTACGSGPLVLPGDQSAAQSRPSVPAEGSGVDNSTPPIFETATTDEPSAPAPIELEPGVSAPADSAAPPVDAAPSVAPAVPDVTPTVDPAFEDLDLPGLEGSADGQMPSPEQRWRYIQVDRNVFEGVQTYTSPSREILWWYDPIAGQTVALGEIQGDFPAQAVFRLRGQEVSALEVPYQINQSFGITVSQPIIDRMRRAGVGEWAETFVYLTEDIRRR